MPGEEYYWIPKMERLYVLCPLLSVILVGLGESALTLDNNLCVDQDPRILQCSDMMMNKSWCERFLEIWICESFKKSWVLHLKRASLGSQRWGTILQLETDPDDPDLKYWKYDLFFFIPFFIILVTISHERIHFHLKICNKASVHHGQCGWPWSVMGKV